MPRPLRQLSFYLRNFLLRDTDVYSMAHGLEVRLLLEHRLVEFVAPLPGRLKITRSVPRRMLIAGLGDALFPEVIRRRKQTPRMNSPATRSSLGFIRRKGYCSTQTGRCF